MLNTTDVEELFQNMLGRAPESRARVEKAIAKHSERASLAAEIRGSPEFRDKAKAALLPSFEQTDRYQAIYALPGLSGPNARPCEDRCAAIEKQLRGPLRCKLMGHLRILDIGCSQGYNSLYFADRGATVFGVDIVENNITFCKLLSKRTGIAASFRAQEFSDATVDFAIANGINVVFLLSILHHVITAKGLGWTRTALKRLLDAKITIFAELALKTENVQFRWKENLPENELAIFEGSHRAAKVGTFRALNGVAARPLYCIQQTEIRYRPLSKDLGTWAAGREERSFAHEQIAFSEVAYGIVPEKHYARAGDKFAKIFRLGATRDRRLVTRAVSLEIILGRRLAERRIAPPIIGTYAGQGFFTIVYQAVKGTDLYGFIKSSEVAARRRCAVAIARKYAELSRLGVFWNDCRHHNILVDEHGEPFFVDFELAGFVELEENRRRFLWTMWHLCHSEHGGLIPEASLPTAQLPAIPTHRDRLCREWLEVTQILLQNGIDPEVSTEPTHSAQSQSRIKPVTHESVSAELNSPVTKDDVFWCYQSLLGRAPESDFVVDRQIAAAPDFRSLVLRFIGSPEFRQKMGAAVRPPLTAPAMDVEIAAEEPHLSELSRRIQRSWAHMGSTTPHYSVLTGREFLPQNMDETSLSRFWQSGIIEAGTIQAMVARHGFRDPAAKVCVEYGCGVGRVTTALASTFASVIGYDISATHLAVAEQRVRDLQLQNVNLYLSKIGADAHKIVDCDVFYSRLVFQHNPPPIVHQLIGMALDSLREGGLAIFQVPTYGADYSFRLHDYLAAEWRPIMEMHCFPQAAIFALAADRGCEILEVREENSIGRPGWISNMFIVRRPEPSRKLRLRVA